MPRVSKKLEHVPAIIREDAILLNGRVRFYSRVRDFRRVSKGCYTGRRLGFGDGNEFTIEGGRHLGGTRRDWFLEIPSMYDKPFHCTSVKDALDLLENM